MEHSIYFSLALILMLVGLIALVVLVNILNKIKEQLNNTQERFNGTKEELSGLNEELGSIKKLLETIGKPVEFKTHGTFTATIDAKIKSNRNNSNMDKKIEEINISTVNEVQAFNAAVDNSASSDTQILDGTISGSFDSKSSGGGGIGGGGQPV